MKQSLSWPMLIGIVLLLSACGSKGNADLQEVKWGMTTSEVRDLVGEPDSINEDGTEWYYNRVTNAVFFEDDRVSVVILDYTRPDADPFKRRAEAFERRYNYEVDPGLDASATQINIKLDGNEVDVIEEASASLDGDSTVSITADSKTGGCSISLKLSRDRKFNGSMTISPGRFSNTSGPSENGPLLAYVQANTSTFVKGDVLKIQLKYRGGVSTEMAGPEHPVEMVGNIVAVIQ